MNLTPPNTPASMIEDGLSTDLAPWWRYYLQKFNPFKRRKLKMEWLPLTAVADMLQHGGHVAVLDDNGWVACYTHDEILTWSHRFDKTKYWCPLPPLP